MTVVLGGAAAKKTWVKGDIVVSLQHVNRQESVVFWRRNHQEGDGAFCVGVSSLFTYFDPRTASPTPEGIHKVQEAAVVMGFSALDSYAWKRLYDALYEAVDEVVKMAPAAPRELNLEGVESLVLRANGDKVFEL